MEKVEVVKCHIETCQYYHVKRLIAACADIKPRHACAARVTVVGSVCLSICLSAKQHFTSGATFRPEINVTYSMGNKGQNFVEISLYCGDTPLPALYGYL